VNKTAVGNSDIERDIHTVEVALAAAVLEIAACSQARLLAAAPFAH
jgi:hypothetical protein